jgi:hypothetical protein
MLSVVMLCSLVIHYPPYVLLSTIPLPCNLDMSVIPQYQQSAPERLRPLYTPAPLFAALVGMWLL